MKAPDATWLVGLLALGACAADSAPDDCSKTGGAACFVVPSAPIAAYRGDGTPQTASLGCGALSATAIDHDITLSGVTTNAVSNASVPHVQLVLFDSTSLASVRGTVTSDANGTYSILLPAGTPDVLHMRYAARNHLPGTLLQHRYDATTTTVEIDPYLMTPDDAETLAGLVRATYDRRTGALAVFARDCDRSRLQHASIVVSSDSGKRAFIDGVTVAYTADGAVVPELLSVQSATSKLGAAGVFNVPVGTTLYAQAWGFPDATALVAGEASLTLLDELAFTVDAGAVLGIELYAH